jgi:hypothetical protein
MEPGCRHNRSLNVDFPALIEPDAIEQGKLGFSFITA